MKIRIGFISNSSTSSFIVFGKILCKGISCSDLEKICKQGKLYADGSFPLEGRDFFHVDKEMLREWKNSTKGRSLDFYQVDVILCEEGTLTKSQLPEEEVNVFHIEIDNHHTFSIDEFRENYIQG